MKTPPTLAWRALAAGLAGVVCIPLLPAQEATAPATSGPARVVVTDTPIEDSVLPTVRPFSSAFGLDSNILDVPRNVTVISREQLDTIALWGPFTHYVCRMVIAIAVVTKGLEVVDEFFSRHHRHAPRIRRDHPV